LGLDLGQANDYTALTIVKRPPVEGGSKEHVYHVGHLERVRNIPYPQIVSKVSVMMHNPTLKDNAVLVVDQTGVGAPVVDLFEQAGLNPVGIMIHGGANVSKEGSKMNVPKRDLVGVMQVLLQSGRLKVAAKLALGSILQSEMLNFKVKIDPVTAHDSYSAWRENEHDDLVLSAAMACWYAEQAEPVDCGWGRSRLYGTPEARTRRMLNDYQRGDGPEPRHLGPSWR
jgi:hypothetical protein